MTHMLADLTWTTIPLHPLVLVPVGSVEQHGPHLPLDTDTTIALAVSHRVAQELTGNILVAPPVTYGSSGEHQDFAGTSSIGTDVLRSVLIELTRSMRTWAKCVVFINGHGGNVAALMAAVSQLRTERHEVAWIACATDHGDLHAGETETSLMLHIRPESVRRGAAQRGSIKPLDEILPRMMQGGVAAVSENGVLGDPTAAAAQRGGETLDSMVRHTIASLGAWPPNGSGMLNPDRQA